MKRQFLHLRWEAEVGSQARATCSFSDRNLLTTEARLCRYFHPTVSLKIRWPFASTFIFPLNFIRPVSQSFCHFLHQHTWVMCHMYVHSGRSRICQSVTITAVSASKDPELRPVHLLLPDRPRYRRLLITESSVFIFGEKQMLYHL